MATDPCANCGEDVIHQDGIAVTQFPGTHKNRFFMFCGWSCLDAWREGRES